ncbi:hypothetical protein PSN45_001521 [Yamadazyma tenuis]|uniref:Uncharacterized protein n=1 Tax=Candida tenuis (strain ATCC 10573 / BCRC 21748 / CBS 615 / JCM 9827 / NBRC 10315 / NRRL Y-1498 / VKM Y-70) TaxID=590646 RepID=G3B2X8_CANTC|nr:uncharacterized protein CANTEDRAFT_113733 [Yamadazyma tenuis ATCC 10573]EGV64452.1 hypothetical protein CANTEDRAFT_113733 [Yamadazyma tenuis ATCC 10573]WEJ94043.1 hypothetical protein PSN45_001521 [Yamadazyma tenuis]
MKEESSFDELLEKEIEINEGDISKVYNRLQEAFLAKYNRSSKLFAEERGQRELLNFYKRRNNALLDILAEAESEPAPVDDKELQARIENVVELNPNLKDLEVLKDIDSAKVSTKLKLSLLLDESISDFQIDDSVNIEKNPEDIEFWLRRNYSNLVLSRFKPIYFSNNRLKKPDNILDNLNTSLNNHVNMGGKKKKKLEKIEK